MVQTVTKSDLDFQLIVCPEKVWCQPEGRKMKSFYSAAGMTCYLASQQEEADSWKSWWHSSSEHHLKVFAIMIALLRNALDVLILNIFRDASVEALLSQHRSTQTMANNMTQGGHRRSSAWCCGFTLLDLHLLPAMGSLGCSIKNKKQTCTFSSC